MAISPNFWDFIANYLKARIPMYYLAILPRSERCLLSDLSRAERFGLSVLKVVTVGNLGPCQNTLDGSVASEQTDSAPSRVALKGKINLNFKAFEKQYF